MVFPVVGGDGKPTGYEIDNSIRFDANSSSYLSFSTSTPTSQKIATWSFWMKKADDATQVIFGSSGDYMEIYNESDGELWFYLSDSNSDFLKSRALHRDQSAWYHIVMVLDTTQGTEANRAKMFVNGTQLTDFISANYPSQNDDLTGLAGSKNFHIGARAYGGAATYLDAYIADFNFIDGTAYDPTYFGETNDNGVWIPKKPTGISYGNNGFFLEFKQTGTSANSSGMGADTSGNDNHFAVNNLASDHITTDTPTNNFATLNPLDRHANVVLSEGNLQTVNTSGGGHYPIFTNMAFKNGKWYAEFKRADGNNWKAAIMSIEHDGGSLSVDSTVGNSVSPVNRAGYGLNVDDGNKTHYDGSSFLNQSYGSEIGSILMWAFDADNGKIWWGEDGTFFASGDPAAGTNAAFTGIDTNTLWTLAFHTYNGHNLIANFGNPPFSISSGNADANGYGNFEYAPPSGFYSLCTKNLAEYG